ncbi:hypothetical protein CSKR_100737, partial [Clonorchis sinensis]
RLPGNNEMRTNIVSSRYNWFWVTTSVPSTVYYRRKLGHFSLGHFLTKKRDANHRIDHNKTGDKARLPPGAKRRTFCQYQLRPSDFQDQRRRFAVFSVSTT